MPAEKEKNLSKKKCFIKMVSAFGQCQLDEACDGLWELNLQESFVLLKSRTEWTFQPSG